MSVRVTSQAIGAPMSTLRIPTDVAYTSEFPTGPWYIASPKASTKLETVKPAPSGTRTAVTRRMPSGATTRTARIAAERSHTAGAGSSRPGAAPLPLAGPAAPPPTVSDPEELAELLLDLVVPLLDLLRVDL